MSGASLSTVESGQSSVSSSSNSNSSVMSDSSISTSESKHSSTKSHEKEKKPDSKGESALYAQGDDRSLATHGDQRSYQYSFIDGFALLNTIRQGQLSYQDDKKVAYPIPPGGDTYSSHRENKEGIFLAEPYYDCKACLERDITAITSGSRSWRQMPRTLILPFVSGSHWRVVRVSLNYPARAVDILWDDPFGAHGFPNRLKDGLQPVIQAQCQALIRKYIQQNDKRVPAPESDFKLEQKSVSSHQKQLDQQRHGRNSWDCGPIVFQNIRDYLRHRDMSNTDFADAKAACYTLRAASNRGHDDWLMESIRIGDRDAYFRIQGQGLLNLSSASDHIKEQMQKKQGEEKEKVVNLVKWSPGSSLQSKIAVLSPYWITVLFTLIETKRVQPQKTLEEVPPSEEELNAAYQEIVKEQVSSPKVIGNQKQSRTREIRIIQNLQAAITAFIEAKSPEARIDALWHISWRSAEISWATKYCYKESCISEKDWLILEFLCEFLNRPQGKEFLSNLKKDPELLAKIIADLNQLRQQLQTVIQVERSKQKTGNADSRIPNLTAIMDEAYGSLHLEEMQRAIKTLQDMKINHKNPIHNKAILRILFILGEISTGKKLPDSLRQKLSKNAQSALNLFEDIRNSLKLQVRKGKQRRVESDEALMPDICRAILSFGEELGSSSTKQMTGQAVASLKQLEQLLSSSGGGKYSNKDQLDILNLTFTDEQKLRYQQLCDRKYDTDDFYQFLFGFSKQDAEQKLGRSANSKVVQLDAKIVEKIEEELKIIKTEVELEIKKSSSKKSLDLLQKLKTWLTTKKGDIGSIFKAIKKESHLSSLVEPVQGLIDSAVLEKEFKGIEEIQEKIRTINAELEKEKLKSKKLGKLSILLTRLGEHIAKRELINIQKMLETLVSEPRLLSLISPLKTLISLAVPVETTADEKHYKEFKENVLLQLERFFTQQNEYKKNSDKTNSGETTDKTSELLANCPWLLCLTDAQHQLLEAMRHKKELNDEEEALSLLSKNGLTQEKINELYPDQYKPKPFIEKVQCKTVAQTAKHSVQDDLLRDIGHIFKDIDQLADLARGKNFDELRKLFRENSLEYLATQDIFESFAGIIKEHQKGSLPSSGYENISVQQFFLLATLRNQIAHRPHRIDSEYIAWFFSRWVSVAPAELKKREQEIKGVLPAGQDQSPLLRMHNRDFSLEEISEHADTISVFADALGFKGDSIRIFGQPLAGAQGVQECLNFIVEPKEAEVDPQNIYELAWELSVYFDCRVCVTTRDILQREVGHSLTQDHCKQLLAQSDLVKQIKFDSLKRRLLSGHWHQVILLQQETPIKKKDIWYDHEVRKISSVSKVIDREHITLVRKEREELFKDLLVRDKIVKKSKAYSAGLIKKVNNLLSLLTNTQQSLVLQNLKKVLSLHKSLDTYYEEHFEELLAVNKEFTRFKFREVCRSKKLDGALKSIVDEKLVQNASECWEEQGTLVQKLSKQNSSAPQILNTFLFIFDEIRSPEIVNFFLNTSDKDSFERLIQQDLESRFLDPHESALQVIHFDEEKQVISSEIGYRTRGGIHILSFSDPLFLQRSRGTIQLTQQEVKQFKKERVFGIRDPFYQEIWREVVREKESKTPSSLVFSPIRALCTQKIYYLKSGGQEAPEDMVWPVERICSVPDNYQFAGKVQTIDTAAVVIDFPPVSNLKEWLEREGLDPKNYPNYEEEETKLTAYLEFEKLIDDMANVQIQILKIKEKIEKAKKAQQEHLKTGKDNLAALTESYQIQRCELLCQQLEEKSYHLFKRALNCDFIRTKPQLASYSEIQRLLLLEEKIADMVWEIVERDCCTPTRKSQKTLQEDKNALTMLNELIKEIEEKIPKESTSLFLFPSPLFSSEKRIDEYKFERIILNLIKCKRLDLNSKFLTVYVQEKIVPEELNLPMSHIVLLLEFILRLVKIKVIDEPFYENSLTSKSLEDSFKLILDQALSDRISEISLLLEIRQFMGKIMDILLISRIAQLIMETKDGFIIQDKIIKLLSYPCVLHYISIETLIALASWETFPFNKILSNLLENERIKTVFQKKYNESQVKKQEALLLRSDLFKQIVEEYVSHAAFEI